MKSNEQIIAEQKAWIASGKIGCVFASALVKIADKIGWHFKIKGQADFTTIDKNTFICSWIFPGMTAQQVREWALNYKFESEIMYGEAKKDGSNDVYEGLRIKMKEGLAWVQYFGPDSHVKTRQAPYPMLSFTCKLPTHIYAKTMAVGILHLAHASIEYLSGKKCDTLWNQSFAATKKILKQSPDKSQAAKVTFLK